MSPFCAILNRPSILEHHPQADYFASDEFREHMKFEGDAGLSARARATVFVLSRCALDPRDAVEGVLRALDRGLVMVELFGVSNPLGVFELPAGEERNAIRAAIKANLKSDMYKAAQRVLKWRDRSYMRRRHEDGVSDRIRKTLPWPTVEDFKNNRETAYKNQQLVGAELSLKMTAVRERRSARLAILARAAAPGVRNWTEFLADVAAATFCQH